MQTATASTLPAARIAKRPSTTLRAECEYWGVFAVKRLSKVQILCSNGVASGDMQGVWIFAKIFTRLDYGSATMG